MHSIAADLIATHFNWALAQPLQSIKPTLETLPNTVYLQKCQDVNALGFQKEHIAVCKHLLDEADSLDFTSDLLVQQNPPKGGVHCIKPLPVHVSSRGHVGIDKHRFFHPKSVCIMKGAASGKNTHETMDAWMQCEGNITTGTDMCAPIGTANWVSMSTQSALSRETYGWVTCGLKPQSLDFELKCGDGGKVAMLVVGYVHSYTSNWGVVAVTVSDQATGETLAFETIDSRHEGDHATLVTHQHIRIPPRRSESVRITILPIQRGTLAATHAKFPATRSLDQQCTGKFVLHGLKCFN